MNDDIERHLAFLEEEAVRFQKGRGGPVAHRLREAAAALRALQARAEAAEAALVEARRANREALAHLRLADDEAQKVPAGNDPVCRHNLKVALSSAIRALAHGEKG